MSGHTYDIAMVGAGICGLAHALAAARRGKRVVVVIDRDAQANGASIRNFGFITVTGQQAGACWRRAMRSRDIWAEIAPQAGIAVLQKGLLTVARRPEARAVLEEFLAGRDGGGDCRLLEPRRDRRPRLRGCGRRTSPARCMSPHEIAGRVARRDPAPRRLSRRAARRDLPARHGRARRRAAPARNEPRPRRGRGRDGVPGRRLPHAAPRDRIAAYGLTRCKLHMMRVVPERFDAAAPAGDVRPRPRALPRLRRAARRGRAACAARSRAGRASRQRRPPDRGAQRPTARWWWAIPTTTARRPTPSRRPASTTSSSTNMRRVFAGPRPALVEHWTGTYASAPDRLMLVDRPC